MKRLMFTLFLVLAFATVCLSQSRLPIITDKLQDAQSSGNGTALSVADYSVVTLAIFGSAGADRVVTFQALQDVTANFSNVECYNVGTMVPSATLTVSGTTVFQFQCNVSGMKKFQATVSGGAVGTVTVTASAMSQADAGIISAVTTPAAGALQDVNMKQANGVTLLTGNGVTGTGSPRVTVASDNTAFPVKIDQTTPGTTDHVSPIAGQNGIAGGTGVDGATVPRMSLATNVPLPTGTNVIGALSANQSTNVAQINAVTPLMGNGVTGTGSQRVTVASDNTAFAVNATLQTGANTIGALTANQSVNVAQVNGVATTTGSGVVGTGVQRVVLATDVALPTGTNVIGALTANQAVNTAQINGVAPTMGNGVSGTGVQRVTLASDSTGQVALATGSATIGALTANQSINAAQVNGVTYLTGNGGTGTGSPRVTLPSNDPCQTSGVVKSSVVVNVTADAQLIALSGSTTIYVCGFSVSIAGTAPTFRLISGTGSVCATGLTGRTGAYAPLTGTYMPAGGAFTMTATAAGEALCMDVEGTSPSVQGVLTYVQQVAP